MWKEGTIGVAGKGGKYTAVHYLVKHDEEPSEDYGIDGGRIFELTLRQDGKEVYNFDRGLDIEPQTEEAEKALAILWHEYN